LAKIFQLELLLRQTFSDVEYTILAFSKHRAGPVLMTISGWQESAAFASTL
jgi:hypothetical protein